MNQLFYIMIVIVRERILRRRRTDILDVGESTLHVHEQTVGETTAIQNEYLWCIECSRKYPTPETLRRTGTSFRSKDFWGQALHMIGL